MGKQDIFIHSYEGKPFLDNFHRFSTAFFLCVLGAWRFWSIQLGTQCWKWNSYLRRITATVERYKNGLTWLFRLGTNHFGSLWRTWKKHLCLQKTWDVQPLHHRVWWSSQCISIHDGWKFLRFFWKVWKSMLSMPLPCRSSGGSGEVVGSQLVRLVGWLVVALCFLCED